MFNSTLRTGISFAALLGFTLANGQSYAPATIFGSNGRVVISDMVAGATSHAVQADGQVVLAGFSYDPNANSYAVEMIRLDPTCGTLDTSFANNGKLRHIFEQRTSCRAIAVQADGKIVAGGTIAPNNWGSQQWAGVYRFHADGRVDSSFHHDGYLQEKLGTETPGTAHEILLDEQQRILGVFSWNSQFGVVRYLENGDLDLTYGSGGRAVFQHSSYVANYGAGTLVNGSVTMLGGLYIDGHYRLAIARFGPQGTLDASFGNNGVVALTGSEFIPIENSAYKDGDIAVLSDGRIVISYTRYGETTASTLSVVAAFLPDGSPDMSFGTNGRFERLGTSAHAGIHVLPDDRILFFFKNHWNDGTAGILCVQPNGILDSGFGDNGILLLPYGPQYNYNGFNDGTMLADGSLLAYGHGESGLFMAARLTTDPEAEALPVISYEYPDLVNTGSGDLQWYLNGEAIAGATGSSHTPTANGTYTVSGACNSVSEPFPFNSTSVQERSAASLHVYPNPTTAHLTLALGNKGAQAGYHVYDATGRAVLQGRTKSDNTVLHTGTLVAGSYHVVVVLESGQRLHTRFVRQ